jgi:hypothetical protein
MFSDQEFQMKSNSMARALACAFVMPVVLFAATPAFACSSCGCNLTSDWLSQGLVAQPGTTISLRYDYVPQTQLRSGSDVVDRSTIPLPTDREIEQHTYNHYVTMAVDHALSPSWAIEVQVPLLSRPHSTITENESDISTSRTHGLGDIRATARFQGFGGPGITGIQFGLKLPTGQFRQTFRSGPETGNDVDRGLQPGTGTVDAVVGAYHFGKLAGAFDFVLQAQGQIPLNSRADYRPGIAGTFSAGVSYTAWKGITPQLQLNFRVAEKDHGLNADRANSGGEQLYIAPGVSAGISNHLSAFAIAQLPLYQRVNGYQLAPKYSLSFGLQYKL